jgi:hypothetical protein
MLTCLLSNAQTQSNWNKSKSIHEEPRDVMR